MQNREADSTTGPGYDKLLVDTSSPSSVKVDPEILDCETRKAKTLINPILSENSLINDSTSNLSKCNVKMRSDLIKSENLPNKNILYASSSKTNEYMEVNFDGEDKEDLINNLFVYRKELNGSYSCKLCSIKSIETSTAQKPSIVRHIIKAHSYCFDFECSSCSDSFKKQLDLENHVTVMHLNNKKNDKSFECSKCKHKSKNEDLLQLHLLRKHASAYRYVCKCCAKCFKSWKAKNDHEKEKQNKKNSNYSCDKCTEVSDSKELFILHLKQVHKEDFNDTNTLHSCKYCSKLFMSRKSLRQHLFSHEKPSILDTQPRLSNPKSTKLSKLQKPLEAIENSIIEMTGFACQQCGKYLSSKDHLKKHERVHTGEKPYSCLECGQAFALRTTMRIHALSHSGIKPYVCELCNLSYSQRSALMIHWKSKHKGMPAPPPIEIHQYFDHEGRVLLPY